LALVSSADMLLAPDIDSYRRLPFYDSPSGKVASFMCDIHTPNGKPAWGCVRSNLKRELAAMRTVQSQAGCRRRA
jgi:glutamine synthetase